MELRLVRTEDVAGIAEIYTPIVLSTPISFEIEPPDEQEIERRIQESLPAFPWIVCTQAGQIVGYAYASRHRNRAAYQWAVDTSVYVHPDFHRRGIGSGLYTSLFAILAAQGYFNAYAGITLPNPGSVALHESVGFQPVGVYRNVGYKQGEWHDVGWWQRPLQSSRGTPRPLLGLDRLESDPGWERVLIAGLSCIRTRSL